MHRFFIPQPYSDTMTIMGVDARHIYTVLRMQCGSRVQIVSDDGVTALAEIADANESVVTVKCLEVLAESHEPSVRIVLAQGLAKGEKMDFIIQKAVELGVSEIIPVAMEHSVVRLEGDKAVKKAERWQKIAEAAAKQSKRDIIPMVQPVQTMEQMLADNPCDCKLIAYECEDKLGLKAALQKEQAFIQSERSVLWECRIECLRIQTYSKENASSGLGRFRAGHFSVWAVCAFY